MPTKPRIKRFVGSLPLDERTYLMTVLFQSLAERPIIRKGIVEEMCVSLGWRIEGNAIRQDAAGEEATIVIVKPKRVLKTWVKAVLYSIAGFITLYLYLTLAYALAGACR